MTGQRSLPSKYVETFQFAYRHSSGYQTFRVRHELGTKDIICSEMNYDIIDGDTIDVHVSVLEPPRVSPSGQVSDMLMYRDEVTITVIG